MALGSLLGRDAMAGAGESAKIRRSRRPRRTPACRVCRIFRPRPSGSSISSSRAPRRRWTSSTTSRDCLASAGIELPDSVRMGQRITTMTSGQKNFPVAPSIFKFAQHGQSGAWLSELLPHTAAIADDICIIRSMQTEAINHDPAITFVQTGSQLAGRPSMGSWVAYGLGSENQDLPAFVVLLSRGRTDQPLYDRLWGSGFLPTRYQGVKLRGGKEPVLYLANPAGCSRPTRRQMLDDIAALNDLHHAETGDPEIVTRIAQYELAYRMQTSVPELTDLSTRAEDRSSTCTAPTCQKPGSYAANCLLARRLAERGRAVHPALSHGLGPARRPARPDQEPVPRHRPAVGGA